MASLRVPHPMRAPLWLGLVLLVPAAWATGSGQREDAEGDQRMRAFLAFGECQDPSLDVVESGFVIGPETTHLWYTVADAEASFRCSPAHLEALGFPWQREVTRAFHLYTQDYAEGSGLYLAWVHDEIHGSGGYVAVYNATMGYARLDVDEQRTGNTWSLTLPSAGFGERRDGSTVPYSLAGPARYYGVTTGGYSSPAFYVEAEDRFGETFGA